MDPSPKVKEIKAKINKWDLIKPKSFCTAKETIDEMKRQPTEWDNIFANDMTDGVNIQHIYNSTSKKQTTVLKKGHKNGIDIFPKRKC